MWVASEFIDFLPISSLHTACLLKCCQITLNYKKISEGVAVSWFDVEWVLPHIEARNDNLVVPRKRKFLSKIWRYILRNLKLRLRLNSCRVV